MQFRLGGLIILLSALASPAAAQSAAPAASQNQSWWERITFSGDFRARYEGFFQDATESRQRGRFRFRVGLRTTLTDGLAFYLRLASGDAADVTSTNQTLTGFWNRKPINIDQAALEYTPPELKALTVGAGKFAYPVTRTQLVWDDDVNWEGTFERLQFSTGPVAWRLVGVQAPLEDLSRGDDALMLGGYAQAGFRAGRGAVQLSIADYAFRNPDRIALALAEGEDIRTQNTNALRRDAAGRVIGFRSGFNLVDAIAQVTLDTGRADYPLIALVDYVVNTRAADGAGTGVWITGGYGRAATPRTFAASVTHARVEQDAVLSAFNFSDMGPATNVVMNMATFSYMPVARLNLDATAILTRRLRAPAGAANRPLARIQIDGRVAF